MPPGGIKGERRARVSGYGLQLREKQKLRRMYGVLERQFRGYYQQAAGRPGATGETLLQLLEARLDNVVYRMGFARDARGGAPAREPQGVQVNGETRQHPVVPVQGRRRGRVAREGPEAGRACSRRLQIRAQVGFPDWVEVDDKKFSGVLKSLPERGDILPDINESLVVELYSK